jgi:hypothetical protein
MPNLLIGEISPYLLQHAQNPVDWQPWGEAAIQRARQEQKPIFLSIGYSACHWCHVMAHESFEDPAIAQLLNETFVNIKVDREERPELDQLYMEAVQMLNGHGGWPLSVFLTPELEPFYGGTYWPPRARHGMPSFEQVVRAVADVWQNRRDAARRHAAELTDLLRRDLLDSVGPAQGTALSLAPLAGAESSLLKSFDGQWGGFGTAPKFPPAIQLRVLLRQWRHQGNTALLEVVCTTLDRMAGGGIYDHLGGGFHRYSVDEQWLVPHFEKMLYDNALLAACYLEAWQATGRDDYRRIVEETLDYVLRDMTDPAGGFYSAEDADSEGEEGKFYVWTPAEIAALLDPPAAAAFCRFYDVTEAGNFEGSNILHRGQSLAEMARGLNYERCDLEALLSQSRRKLLAVRNGRVRPGRDDKILVNWNGLMIDALARAGAALGRGEYVEAAARAAQFILDRMCDPAGRLLHCWRRGEARVGAFVDDYAALADALVSLYEATFEERWLAAAMRLVEVILAEFADPAGSGFFFAVADEQALPARKKDALDAPLPSGTGLALMALLRLGKLCQRNDFIARVEKVLLAHLAILQRGPTAVGQMLLVLDMLLSDSPEIVILAGHDATANSAVLAHLRHKFLPNKVLAMRDPAAASPVLESLFAGKQSIAPGPTVHLCQNQTCQAPVTGSTAVIALWDRLAK